MTEGRHHRRRDDDHTEDGIYFPPPREVPRSRTAPQLRPVDPSPWAPTAPDRPAPQIPPAPPPAASPAPRQSPPRQPGGDPHPPEAPVYYARAADWTVRPSPWATVEDDEFADDGTYAPAEAQPPPPPVQPQHLGGSAAVATRSAPEAAPRIPEPALRIPEPAPRIPAPRPTTRPTTPAPAPSTPVSSTTAWWIAAGVIVVALAVAAGILVGLNLAQRGG
ncbi:hypothetical protein Daura_05525 [Dactylosporangium aurantiacum]|uniref:Uncharacterized protein n=1 Tax=Dactylosporangium aurantiacum TaxID=35754 RepID=A0A9Q9IJ06_9ACTN|nr:hypothetical protein [Dactylosporangium aurantiacum]MDG6104772.1 hypothetical protein [Dactylosporangium aurantiacum]UWZ55668.1 hypothetical protein Daura_05525 [Dactylosporangium aurantiacum]